MNSLDRFALGGPRFAVHLVELLPAQAYSSTCRRCRRSYWSSRYMNVCLRPDCGVVARARSAPRRPSAGEMFRAINELDFRAAALRELGDEYEHEVAADIERVARWLEGLIDPEELKRGAP